MLRSIVFPAALLATGLALTLFAYSGLREAEQQARLATFERIAGRAVDDARLRLSRPMYGLSGIRAAAAAASLGEVPTLREIEAYVDARDLPGEFPGVWGMGLIVPVARSAIPSFEAGVRAEGDPDFQVRGEGGLPDLYVIKTLEPRSSNFHAIGYDVGSEAIRRRAVERAVLRGLPALTGPIELVQDEARRPAAVFMAPIFASGRPTASSGHDRVVAVAFAPFVYDDLMAEPGRDPAGWLRVAIIDRSVGGGTVFDSQKGLAAWEDALTSTANFDHFGRDFDIVVSSTPAFVHANPLNDGRLLLVFGVGLSVLAALAARQQVRLRSRAEALAASMTRDLHRLAAVARLTKNAVVITDANRRTEWVNPAFRELSGFTEDELRGRKPGDLLQTPETSPAEIARLSATLERGEPFVGVLLNRSKQGRLYSVQVEIQPIRSPQGELEGYISVEADITERLAQDEALRASRALLEKTGQVSGVGGWRLDLVTNALTWTDVTRRIHDVPPGYVPDVPNALQFYPADAREAIRSAIERAVASGESWDLELPFITYTGRPRWVRAAGEPERRDGKAVALHGAIADITELVAERQRLAIERERLEMILLGTNVGTWEWNVQTGETRFNERWADIVGHRLADFGTTTIQTWASIAHPEDLERSNGLLQRHFAGELPFYDCEARMRHRDGHWVWVLDRGRVMTWTADGKPEWMFGTHLDITERKLAELRLAENEALLSTTLHSIGDAVLTTDADGRITWINPVAEAMTGWSTDEALGRMADDVLHLEIEGREGHAPCPVRACLDEGRKVGLAGNTTLVARNGTRYVIEDSAAPLREANGPVRGVIMVFHDVTEKAKLASEMNYRASHDALTGLVNRAEFEGELTRALERARASGGTGALMFLDLDHFKVVNDACGHAAGDRLLVQIAALLKAGVRTRDLVGRFGGDEFAILLEDCPLDRAQKIAEQIVEAVDAYRYIGEDGRRFRVGLSAGLVPIDRRWINMSQLIQGADAACYAAKAEGRGRVVVDQGVLEIASHAQKDMKWGPLIEQAIDEDLFELYAQRVVPLRTETSPRLRCEVLLRLRDPEGRLHGPGEFIPAAERYQLASRIDRWVLRNVLAAMASARIERIARVAVNVSGQSAGDRAFHRFALQAIADSGLPPERLCIEITETALVTNFADAATFIEDLHALGVQVALDDFGAGASSFGYLKSLKVDVLKIDGQFVRGLLQGELEAAALRSFVDVATVLGLRTVAEQVEDEAVATRLTKLGVDFGQGYHFHRPEPMADLIAKWNASESKIITPVFPGAKKRSP